MYTEQKYKQPFQICYIASVNYIQLFRSFVRASQYREYRYASVGHRYRHKKVRGVDQKSSQYLVWPPFTSYSMTHLLCIELIRLLIVACGKLSHSSRMAVQSCWIVSGTGARCRTSRSRASYMCSMGDMSGEYAGHETTGTFSASWGIVYRSLQHGAVLPYYAETCDGAGWIAWQWASGFLHGISVHSNYHR
jgi:hypothetical protein